MASPEAAAILAWHQDPRGMERLAAWLAAVPRVRLAGQTSEGEEFLARAAELKPALVVLEGAPRSDELAELVGRLRRASPRSQVVLLAASREPEDILAALRLGVGEYLAEPLPAEEFTAALARLLRRGQESGGPAGRVLALMGVKGGVGTSSLAVNLAVGLARRGRVALVDLDLAAGNLAQLLDLAPARDLADVAANLERLDAAFLEGLLVEAGPNLKLLAAPADPVAAEEVGTGAAGAVGQALDLLTGSHAFLVVDLPCRLDETSLLALDRADRVGLVLEPTVVCLKAARRLLDLGERLWRHPERLVILLNRSDCAGAVSPRDAAKALGRPILAALPNDARTIMEAANAGLPALRERPRAKWCRAVAALAEQLGRGGEKAS